MPVSGASSKPAEQAEEAEKGAERIIGRQVSWLEHLTVESGAMMFRSLDHWNEGGGVKVLLFGVMAALTGCATGGSGAQSASTAEVVVTAIAPVAGSEVQQSSVIEATVQFTIERFKPKGNTYYLLTQFEDTSGGSVESDSDRRLADHPILTAAKGSVIVTYPLARVWGNAKLRKPLKVWFCVLENIGPNDSVVIGRSAPIQYVVK
jgi:hypothetical protein